MRASLRRRFVAKSSWSFAALAPLVAGCLGAAAPEAAPGKKVTVHTAPLVLPNVAEVCYGVTVFNGPPGVAGTDTVWTQDPVCSVQFGNGGGGDAALVGPCDATTGDNYVQLTLETIRVDAPGGSLSGNVLDDQLTSTDGDPDFQNPCPPGTPCTLKFGCVENQDVAVTFDLVVMRDADQGFFDIGVNFEDVFCSLKVDCAYDAGGADPIKLLFDAQGNRAQTAVIGLACTQGAGTNGTVLNVNGPRVICDGDGGGQAFAPIPLAYTCTANGDFYGSVFGQIDGQFAGLPTRWHDVNGVPAVDTLPLGSWTFGVIKLRLDETHLAGIVSNAFPKDQLAPSALAIWAFDGTDWVLESTAAGPADTTWGLETIVYDNATGRLWAQFAIGNSESKFAFWQKTAASGWTFEAARVLPVPQGFDRCYTQSNEGQLVIGQCSDQDLNTTFVVWDLGDVDSITMALLPAPTFPDLGGSPDLVYFGNASMLTDGSVVGWATGQIQGSSYQEVVARWTFASGTWSADLVAPEYASSRLAWEMDDIFVIASGNQNTVTDLRRPSGNGGWDIWTTFALNLEGTHTIQEVAPLGYVQALDAIYGRVQIDGDAHWIPFVAALPANSGDDVVLTLLPLPSGAAFSDAYWIGIASTPTAPRLIMGSDADPATADSDFRVVLWELARDSGGTISVTRWIEPDARRYFHDFAGIQSRGGEEGEVGHLATAPSCDDAFGTDPDPASSQGAGTPSRWAFGSSASGDSVSPTYYPTPDVFTAQSSGSGPVNIALDPTVTGNAWSSPHAGDAVWQYASYHGTEQLECGDKPCQKVYWNTAIGFDPTRVGCRVVAEATIAAAPGLTSGYTPDDTFYPYITIDVQLTSKVKDGASGAPQMVCRQNAPDEDGSGAKTQYTQGVTPHRFCHAFDGTTPTTLSGCDWDPTAVAP